MVSWERLPAAIGRRSPCVGRPAPWATGLPPAPRSPRGLASHNGVVGAASSRDRAPESLCGRPAPWATGVTASAQVAERARLPQRSCGSGFQPRSGAGVPVWEASPLGDRGYRQRRGRREGSPPTEVLWERLPAAIGRRSPCVGGQPSGRPGLPPAPRSPRGLASHEGGLPSAGFRFQPRDTFTDGCRNSGETWVVGVVLTR